MKSFCGRTSTLLVLSAIFSALPGLALDPNKTLTQYAHRIWGQEEGLFQPTIYSILQTPDGFLWLGTQDSLIRFDGMHFREFDEAGFHRSLVRTLMEDAEGNLWIGSLGGGVAKVTPRGIVGVHRAADGDGRQLPANLLVSRLSRRDHSVRHLIGVENMAAQLAHHCRQGARRGEGSDRESRCLTKP